MITENSPKTLVRKKYPRAFRATERGTVVIYSGGNPNKKLGQGANYQEAWKSAAWNIK